MKKVWKALALLLAVGFCFSFSAAAVSYDYFEATPNSKAQRINEVISLIESIGDVTYATRQSVYAADRAYEALPTQEKSYVVNFDKLCQDRETLNRMGDLNTDGKCNANDLALLKKKLLSGSDLTSAFDINGDGQQTVVDLIALKKLILGI